MIKDGRVTDVAGVPLKDGEAPAHESIRIDGDPPDPTAPLTLMLNKPDGYTCSLSDPGDVVYELLPQRFSLRKPVLSPVGRLDKDTTGLLLMTDDGQLLHRIIHPKSACGKVYRAMLDRPLEGHEAALFSSGEMMLKNETKPLLPAKLEILGEREALVTLNEGRYHQVRRMFAAAGNHVTELQRIAIGSLKLPDDLKEGEWRVLSEAELALIN